MKVDITAQHKDLKRIIMEYYMCFPRKKKVYQLKKKRDLTFESGSPAGGIGTVVIPSKKRLMNLILSKNNIILLFPY